MPSRPELIANYHCETGENPLWHPTERRLYWTDIPGRRMFRYDPATSTHEQCYQGRAVGGFTIQQDGSLLLFMDQGTVACWRDGAVGRPARQTRAGCGRFPAMFSFAAQREPHPRRHLSPDAVRAG